MRGPRDPLTAGCFATNPTRIKKPADHDPFAVQSNDTPLLRSAKHPPFVLDFCGLWQEAWLSGHTRRRTASLGSNLQRSEIDFGGCPPTVV